jgi:hypothetical protein
MAAPRSNETPYQTGDLGFIKPNTAYLQRATGWGACNDLGMFIDTRDNNGNTANRDQIATSLKGSDWGQAGDLGFQMYHKRPILPLCGGPYIPCDQTPICASNVTTIPNIDLPGLSSMRSAPRSAAPKSAAIARPSALQSAASVPSVQGLPSHDAQTLAKLAQFRQMAMSAGHAMPAPTNNAFTQPAFNLSLPEAKVVEVVDGAEEEH